MPELEHADSVFANAKVVTLDSSDQIASAVAVKDGRIMGVGAEEEIRKLSDAATTWVDLHGKTVLPGLVDSHCHIGLASRSFIHYVDGRCPPNHCINDILERIREKAKQTPKGQLISVHGSMFGDQKLVEKRFPTKEELDSVAPDHPVIMLASVHTIIANSYTVKLAEVTRDTHELSGGIHVEHDPDTGEPTGVFREGSPVGYIPLSYEQYKETIRSGIERYWIPQGITSAYSFTTDGSELKAYQELLAEGSLPLRVKAMFCEFDNTLVAIDDLLYLGILPGFGTDRLSTGGVKIFVDGAFMTLSAASKEPYFNLPDPDHRGYLRITQERLDEYVKKSHDAGLTLCIHAMGDRAQEMALDAYEKALTANPRLHRHRIEHFGCDMGSPELRRRAKELGILPNITSGWLYSYGDFIEPHLGPERSRQSFALRSMIDDGLRPADSSDQCGTDPMTLDPFHSMWCAVTRQTFFGSRFVPEEAIGVKDALRLWTINGAYSGGEEDLKGSIETEKLADMIVISDDILTIAEDRIRDIKVDLTIVGGQVVHERSVGNRS
ncbi:MAG: amidohydrolase [Acidobacteriota bacterium]